MSDKATTPGIPPSTSEEVLKSDERGLVAYAGQSFGPHGLKPLFMVCFTRDIFELMVREGHGFNVDVEVDGKVLNLRLFARETKQQAIQLIAERQMTEEQAKAVQEQQGATRQ